MNGGKLKQNNNTDKLNGLSAVNNGLCYSIS